MPRLSIEMHHTYLDPLLSLMQGRALQPSTHIKCRLASCGRWWEATEQACEYGPLLPPRLIIHSLSLFPAIDFRETDFESMGNYQLDTLILSLGLSIIQGYCASDFGDAITNWDSGRILFATSISSSLCCAHDRSFGARYS